MGLIEGKVAIVTGAGRGIGKAVAQLLAEHGASVLVNDLDEAVAGETVQEIRQAGGKAECCAGSVTDAAFPKRLLGTAVDSYGTFDIIVNNAGYTHDGMIHKMSDEQWQAMLDCHLTAPFRILREAGRHWREWSKAEAETGLPKARKVINVSSTSGVAGNAGQVNYAAGKMGIVGVTKTLAREWGRLGVCVNAVAYGFIDTRLTAAKSPSRDAPRASVDGNVIELGIPEQMREAAIQRIPLGRPGSPREAAGPVLFLASPLADFVTGHVVLVTGGSYM